MKLYMETDEGKKIEIKEIQNIKADSEVLIFFIERITGSYEYIKAFEYELSRKTGKICIVLDGVFSEKIYGV